MIVITKTYRYPDWNLGLTEYTVSINLLILDCSKESEPFVFRMSVFCKYALNAATGEVFWN